jgi:hypothetical protein
MAERWFSDQELAEMARPTMDRAIEALGGCDAVIANAGIVDTIHRAGFAATRWCPAGSPPPRCARCPPPRGMAR